MEELKQSLIDFVRKYKSSDYRRKRLLEDLEYVIHQMYAIPGPLYDRVGGTTNVKPDRMIILMDKKDRIERALLKIEEDKKLFNSFVVSLTEKQKEMVSARLRLVHHSLFQNHLHHSSGHPCVRKKNIKIARRS